jgi:hypothetical protein
MPSAIVPPVIAGSDPEPCVKATWGPQNARSLQPLDEGAAVVHVAEVGGAASTTVETSIGGRDLDDEHPPSPRVNANDAPAVPHLIS